MAMEISSAYNSYASTCTNGTESKAAASVTACEKNVMDVAGILKQSGICEFAVAVIMEEKIDKILVDQNRRMFKMRKQGKILKIIWWMYIVLLFVVVVVKFKGSFYELGDRINSYSIQGSINYNLIPFRSMSTQIEHITQWWALKNLLGNIIPFIPFGFLLPIAYKKFSSTKVLSTALASILLIEIFQFVTKLGSFDVDDIILNMLGIVCGYLIFLVINRIFVREQYMRE